MLRHSGLQHGFDCHRHIRRNRRRAAAFGAWECDDVFGCHLVRSFQQKSATSELTKSAKKRE